MWKFARQWFGLYVVINTNDNSMYHLAELDRTRMVVPVAGKWIKVFKKRQEVEPDPKVKDEDESGRDRIGDRLEEDE